jgi:hypothetical protein
MSNVKHSHRLFSYGSLPHRRSLSATVFAAAIWLALVITVSVAAPGVEQVQQLQVSIPAASEGHRLKLPRTAVLRLQPFDAFQRGQESAPALRSEAVDADSPGACAPLRG